MALKWSDVDFEKGILSITRSLERSKKGVKFKTPKTARGRRVVDLDPGTVALLLEERRKHQQIMAGVEDGAGVDLSLIKLPQDALVFPVGLTERTVTFTKTRDPVELSRNFRRIAKRLGFPKVRLHNLRHSHATALLDAKVAVHRVAARIGDDPAILLRIYARLTKQKNDTMSEAANALGTLILGSG